MSYELDVQPEVFYYPEFEEELSGEVALGGSSPKPRVLTFSKQDVIDERISVPAQYSLVRLSKNPSTSIDAVGMLEAIKSGRLAGIYCVNWKRASDRAEMFGKHWWTVIPTGEDAVLLPDPDNLENGPPMIAFRRELDPRNDKGCGSLKTDRSLNPFPERLDTALLRVWRIHLQFFKKRYLRPPLSIACCPTGLINYQAQQKKIAKQANVPCVRPNAKLSFYQYYEDNMQHTNFFKNTATLIAKHICAVEDPRYNCNELRIGPTPYRNGNDIITAITYACDCISKVVNEVHICSHSSPGGLFSQFRDFTCGLYPEYLSLNPADRGCGARTVADIPFNKLSNDVVFFLRGCDTAKKATEYYPPIAQNLFQVLQRNNLTNAKVYGHPDQSTWGSVAGNSNWIEFSGSHPDGKKY